MKCKGCDSSMDANLLIDIFLSYIKGSCTRHFIQHQTQFSYYFNLLLLQILSSLYFLYSNILCVSDFQLVCNWRCQYYKDITTNVFYSFHYKKKVDISCAFITIAFSTKIRSYTEHIVKNIINIPLNNVKNINFFKILSLLSYFSAMVPISNYMFFFHWV